MKRLVSLTSGALIALLIFSGAGCGSDKKETAGGGDSAAAAKSGGDASMGGDMAKRGEYLVTIMGCGDCHTPKKMGPEGPMPDESRMLSGHPADEPLAKYDPALVAPGKWIMANQTFTAYAGPWGVSYAANLTPDPTGLGGWTEAQFMKAVREGKYKGMDNTRPLLPPMPWQIFASVSDDDVKAIFAYLQTVKPVANAVPAAMLAGPPPGAAAGAPPADTTAKPAGA